MLIKREYKTNIRRRILLSKGESDVLTKEIKNWRLSVGEYKDIAVNAPVSVISALTELGIIPEPYYAECPRDAYDTCKLGASFIAEFELESIMILSDFLELDIGGIDAPALLVINGSPVMRIEKTSLPGVDVKRFMHLGKNTVELRFDPRLPDSSKYITDIGLFAPIRIVSYNKAAIDDVVVKQSYNAGRVRLDVKMTTKGYVKSPRCVALLVSPGGDVSYLTMIGGEGWVEIGAPNLWRPERRTENSLYRLTVNLYSDTELTDSREYKIGLASATYDPERKPALTLSGQPWYPTVIRMDGLDFIKPRLTDSKLMLILGRAKDAGADMLLIPTSSGYPTEALLSMCDRIGLAVMIELDSFPEPVGDITDKQVIRDIERLFDRLSNHTSVLIFTGAISYKEKILSMIEQRIPGAVYIEDAGCAITTPPSLMTVHSVRKYLPEDSFNILSECLTGRAQKGVDLLLENVLKSYRMPHSFEDWMYLSELISAEYAVDKLIGDRLSAEGYGALLGSLGEPVPTVSASIVDYTARVKAMYYRLAKESKRSTVYSVIEDGVISFFAYNMTNTVYKARLTYAINDNYNVGIVRDNIEIEAAPYTIVKVYEYDAREVVKGNERRYYLYHFVSDDTGAHSHSTSLFVLPRVFNFVSPMIRAELVGAQSDYTLTLSATAFARAVEISFGGDDDIVIEDNYFDLVSEVPLRLKVKSLRPTAVETLKREMRIRSMYDVGR